MVRADLKKPIFLDIIYAAVRPFCSALYPQTLQQSAPFFGACGLLGRAIVVAVVELTESLLHCAVLVVLAPCCVFHADAACTINMYYSVLPTCYY